MPNGSLDVTEDARTNPLADEIKEIINGRGYQYAPNYVRIRDAYKNHYDWPEMDTLRQRRMIQM